MTDQIPERIWAFPKKDWFNAGASTHRVKVAGAKDVEYLRADTVIPRAEADAMVAAVVERIAQERDAEARYWSEACNDDERVYHDVHAKKIRALTPADARAAFEQAIERAKLQSALDSLSNEIEVQKEVEQAVREAVEAERERCAKIADSYHEAAIKWASVNMKSFDGDTDSKRIADDIRAPQEPTPFPDPPQ